MEQLGRKSRQKVGSPEGEPGDLGVSYGLGPRGWPGVHPYSALKDDSAGGGPG